MINLFIIFLSSFISIKIIRNVLKQEKDYLNIEYFFIVPASLGIFSIFFNFYLTQLGQQMLFSNWKIMNKDFHLNISYFYSLSFLSFSIFFSLMHKIILKRVKNTSEVNPKYFNFYIWLLVYFIIYLLSLIEIRIDYISNIISKSKALVFTLSIFCLFNNRKSFRFYKFIFFSITLIIFIFFQTGSRGIVTSFVIILVLYERLHKKNIFNFNLNILILILGGFFISGLNFVETYAYEGILNYKFIGLPYEPRVHENFAFIKEQIDTNQLALYNGSTYLGFFHHFLSKIFNYEYLQLPFWYVKTFFYEQYLDGWGAGFSILAEGYMNFGFYGFLSAGFVSALFFVSLKIIMMKLGILGLLLYSFHIGVGYKLFRTDISTILIKVMQTSISTILILLIYIIFFQFLTIKNR